MSPGSGRTRCRRRGSVALLAVGTLVVVLTLAVAMLELGRQTLVVGRHQPRTVALRAIAEAGIEFGYWQYAWNGVSVPYTAAGRPFGGGTFDVIVSDNRGEVPYTLKITSTARLGRDSLKAVRVVADPGIGGPKRVYDFALAAGSGLASAIKNVVVGSSSTPGDLYSAAAVSLTNSGSRVYGRTYSGGSVAVTTMNGLDYAYVPAVAFPAIDLATYQTIASRTFASGQVWNGFAFALPYEVVYVNGNLSLRGTISGTGTIVCSRLFTQNGSISYSGAASLAVVSAGGITFSSGTASRGIFYTHNASGTALVTVGVNVTVSPGLVIGDVVTLDNDLTVVPDPLFSLSVAQSHRLPGL